jgi:DNA invertase Pin-like site-specific DNA recombinase
MALYGYARVSHVSQSLDVQIEALRAAGCTVIRSEKKSGTTTEGRVELQTLLDFVRDGDTICVTRVDRIARSIADLQDILRVLKAKGASLKATEQPIDTSTPLGKCMLDLLGVFAELETNLRRERQMESIRRIKEIDNTRPKSERTYRGRPPTIKLLPRHGGDCRSRSSIAHRRAWSRQSFCGPSATVTLEELFVKPDLWPPQCGCLRHNPRGA